jgi:O-antigen/teichoic acid export membrane protein
MSVKNGLSPFLHVGREALWSLGLKVTYAGLTLLATMLLVRLLGAVGYGVYAYIFALITVLSIPSQFGLPPLVIRETAKGMVRADAALVRGIWVWAGRFVVVTSLGLALLAGLAVWFWQERFSGAYLGTFGWALLLVPLVALGNLRGAALRGLHRVVQGQLPENLLQPGVLVLLLGGALLVGLSFSPAQAMALQAAAAAVAFGAGAGLLLRATPAEVRRAYPRFEGRLWLQSVLPLAFIGGMQLINTNASIVILGFFVPAEQIGIYRVAVQASILASFGLQAINMVVAPRFASLYDRREMERLQHLATFSARAVLAFNLLVTAGAVLLGRWFLGLFFGVDFVAAYMPLMILLIGQFVNSATGSLVFLLNMTGHERETARGRFVSAALNVLLNLLLVPLWGIIGAAVATAAGLVTWNALLWWAVRKRLGINSLAFNFGWRRGWR